MTALTEIPEVAPAFDYNDFVLDDLDNIDLDYDYLNDSDTPKPTKKAKSKPKAKSKGKSLPKAPKPVYLNRATYINDPVLIDESNFQRYFSIIHAYHDKLMKVNYSNSIDDLIKQKRLPYDYRQRLIIRQLSQGIYFKPEILSENKIEIVVFDDGIDPNILIRRPHEYRQPSSPFDFVKIDPDYWQDYGNMNKFYKNLSAKPDCSYTKNGKNYIKPRDLAIQLPYIAPYHPQVTGAMIFDIDCMDRGGAWAFELWKEYNLPSPNIIIKNPVKESYQYIYLLRDPVCNWGEISKSMVYKFDLIYEHIRQTLQADKCFNGRRMKNPFSHEHDTFVSGAEPYCLDDLADKADIPDQEEIKALNKKNSYKKVKLDTEGYMGRNCAIFDHVRHLGYRNANMGYTALHFYLLSECEQYNEEHYSDNRLPQKELCNIAKSITRFCKSERFRSTPENKAKRSEFARVNVAKANANGACSKGGIARSATFTTKRTLASELHAQGVSKAQIALQVGVSRKTITIWLKE